MSDDASYDLREREMENEAMEQERIENELDLWADDMEPEAMFVSKVYRLRLSNAKLMELRTQRPPYAYVEVEDDGLLNVQDISYFNGKKFGDMTWEERKEVYDWLIEWEFAEWRRIGPEDSELFATTKLYGEPV